MDEADQHQNNVEINIEKRMLDRNGGILGVFHETEVQHPDDYCGSCHDAKIKKPDGSPLCCNSCSSVFAAYEHEKLPSPKMKDIPQCVEEAWPEKIEKHSNEGCRVSGRFPVNKIAGNFHFAPGKSFDVQNYHLHDIRFLDGLHLDFAHKIHHLSFGEHHAQIINPLDGTEKHSSGKPQQSFKYHVKVVAAEMHHLNGRKVLSNQYAVTQNDNDTRGMSAEFPSLFFHFDISPMIIIHREFKKSFASFLTSVCAIIGGVYTIAAIVDSIIFHAERNLIRKKTIGKAN